MRIFIQVTTKGEKITWYGFDDTDIVEAGQHVVTTRCFLDNPVAFNNENSQITVQYQNAVDDFIKLEKPN